MPQAHFIECRDDEGNWALLRADKIELIQPYARGLRLHTASAIFEAQGATRETIAQDLQSAQIVLVALNRGVAAPLPKPEPTEAPTPEPARAAVVRAPPPVTVPGVTDIEPEAKPETEPAPAKKVARKPAG